MCIPPDVSRKLAEYYEKTGQSEKAAQQRESIRRIDEIVCKRGRTQHHQKEGYQKTIFTHCPSYQTTIRLITLTAIFVSACYLFSFGSRNKSP